MNDLIEIVVAFGDDEPPENPPWTWNPAPGLTLNYELADTQTGADDE